MALQPQAVTLSLRQGLDTKTDPKQVVFGKLLLLENGILTTIGQVRKRNGYAALPTTVVPGGLAITSARLLSTFKGQLFLGSGLECYGFSAGDGAWSDRGPCEAAQLAVAPVIRNTFQQVSPDAAVHPLGVAVSAWEDSSGGCRYCVVDAATNQPIVSNAVLGTNAARPKTLVFGSYVAIVYYEQAVANHLRYVLVPVLSPTQPTAPVDLAVNVNASQLYDATVSNGRLFYAYHNTAGSGQPAISVRYLNGLLVASNEFTVQINTISVQCIGVFCDTSGNVWVTMGEDFANVNVFALDFNLAGFQVFLLNFTSGTAVNVRNVTGMIISPGKTASVFYELPGGSPPNTSSIVLARATWQPNLPVLNSATPGGGGTLAAGTYYYKVTAHGGGGQPTSGETLPSNELSATVGANGSVALAWSRITDASGNPVSGATYLVYRGTSPGAETAFQSSAVDATTFTDTGGAGTPNSLPIQNSFAWTSTPRTTLFRSVGLGSKPWFVNGAEHLLLAYQSALQPTYFVGTTAGKVVGKLALGVGGGLTAKAGLLPEVTQVGASTFAFAYLATDQIGAQAGVVLAQTGANLATLNYAAPQMALELSDDLHVTGAMLQSYDGAQCVEHNFHLYPENVSAVPSTTGGLLSAGQYQYVVVWEWWDNFVIHQSAPSVPLTVTTTTGTSSVALTIPTLRLTNRSTAIAAVVYRTTANGTTFFRLTPPANPLLNSTTVDTVPYADAAADSAIVGNAQLYTTGGEVENWGAPAPIALCEYNGRLMLVPAEDPLTVWFSKQVLQGVPVEFSPFFVFTVDQRGGPITAIAQMDEKFIIFKRDWIFYTIGDGPAPNGTPIPAYPAAQFIASDVGCRSLKSVVLTPAGLMFQSDKGIFLLSRGLTTSYIGAPVEAFNSANVVAAAVVPSTTQVRFALDSGAVLVYDWLVDQWATFTNLAAADAAIYGGQFTLVQATGLALQEAPGVFTDNGAAIKLRLRTSWLSFAGLQGFQRVWEMLVLGEFRSPHSLVVGVAFDFDPTGIQGVVVPAGALLSQTAYGADSPYGQNVYGGPFPLYQFRVKMLREKCQAVQVTLEDSQTAPFGEGLSLSALLFNVGMIAGAKKVPAGRTFGF